MPIWELVDLVQSSGKSLSALLAKLAAERADNPALLASRGPVRSFARLESQIRGIGNVLALRGLGGDSRVAIILPDSADTAVVTMGVMAHAVALPMNPRNPPEDLLRNLRLLRAEAIITSAGITVESARKVASELSLPVFRVMPNDESESELLAVEDSAARISNPKKVTFRGGDDIAMILCTSGTTGRAKIVPLSHNNFLSTMLGNCQMLELAEEDRCLSIMPLFHVHGLGALFCSILAGGSVVVSEGGFSADSFFNLLSEFNATWYTAVPTVHRAILDLAPKYESRIAEIVARGGLRFVRSGSAPMPRGIPARLESLFHTIYIEGGGLTETSAYICSNRPGRRRIGSIGLPMPGTEVRVLDETLQPLGVDVTGELAVRGPGVFHGYEGDTENDCFVDGFFRTGDLGHFDEDGFFFITGRIKEQINRAGMKISPGEVDAILHRHPSVADVVTFAIPDDRLGQEVAAAIVLRDGASATDLEIQRFAAQQLADYKVPRRIIFLSEIPKTSNGKVLRVDLVKQLNLESEHTEGDSDGEEKNGDSPKKPMTPLEQTIAVIFSDVLNRPVWDVSATLPSLGADSLQALQICMALEERFKRSIPLAALTMQPSIQGIAKLLNEDACALSPGSPITLREGSPDGPNLFVIPGVGGNVYSFHGLARHLPKEWRVIGIPLPGADGLEDPLTSIIELAERFLKIIQPAAGSHPCFLLGYSFGGKLAFEIAGRLIGLGFPPPNVILYDTPAPGWAPQSPWTKRIRSRLHRAREDGVLGSFRRLFESKSSSRPADTASTQADELALGLTGQTPGNQRAIERKLRESCQIAIQQWRANPAALYVHLLRAADTLWPSNHPLDKAMGWERVALAGVKVFTTPGSHGTIFHEENVGAMAEQTIAIVKDMLNLESAKTSTSPFAPIAATNH